MEKIKTDWPDISELHFDSVHQTLEIVFRSGATKVLHHVCKLGFERFIGRAQG
jgi:hypothetical protein